MGSRAETFVCSIPEPSQIGNTHSFSATEGRMDGNLEKLLAVEKDIMQGEVEALARNEASLILDHAATGMFLADESLTLVHVNRAGRAMFGIAQDEGIEGISVTDMLDDPETAEATGAMQMAQGLRQSNGFRRDGTSFPVCYAVDAVSGEGAPGGSVWIVHELSAASATSADSGDRQEAAVTGGKERKFEALGMLASGIAHEIDTPVQYVRDNVLFLRDAVTKLCALTALYEEGASPREIADVRSGTNIAFLRREAPEAVSQSLHGLGEVARIVSAVRKYAHPGSDAEEAIEINDVVNDAVTLSRGHWTAVARIALHLDPSGPVVSGNRGDLAQVLVNMIANAAFAIGKKGGGHITLSTRDGDDGVEMSVADDGGGIPVEIVDRIFEPFFTTKDNGEGSGQGLAISHAIITTKYQGRISCENDPGQGVRFTVFLPCSRVPSPTTA